jgi:hypothetical protein
MATHRRTRSARTSRASAGCRTSGAMHDGPSTSYLRSVESPQFADVCKHQIEAQEQVQITSRSKLPKAASSSGSHVKACPTVMHFSFETDDRNRPYPSRTQHRQGAPSDLHTETDARSISRVRGKNPFCAAQPNERVVSDESRPPYAQKMRPLFL